MSYQLDAKLHQQLHTVGDYTRFLASEFNRAELYFGHGCDNAWDEAITLIMHVLALPDVLSEHIFSCRLTEQEKHLIFMVAQQRIGEQIPLAYIIHQAQFAGLPFYVDERVLVPRSPIAEYIEQGFTSLLPADKSVKRILDLCTGSGCIAIACAHYLPEAEVDALDLSIDALNVAQINIENHNMQDQVTPICSDLFNEVSGHKYDLIVTNPPYVDQEDVDNLPQEYKFEPAMGLGSGQDGLDLVRKILAQSAQYLNDGGLLICEVGNSQVHIEANYPQVPFNWLTFTRGGHGVFTLTKETLVTYEDILKKQVKN